MMKPNDGTPHALSRPVIFSMENLLAGLFSVQDLQNAIGRVADGADVQFAVLMGKPIAVHLSCGIPAQSFALHHAAVNDYINKVTRFLVNCGLETGWLSGPDGVRLAEAIGMPPCGAQPIYFMTAEKAGMKEVVYVGRTAAEQGRFVGGHHAITKLHAPQYDGASKQIYQASVLVRISESEWIALELVKPQSRANFYLSEIELNLIFALQPALNETGREALAASAAHHVLIQDPYGLVRGVDRTPISTVRR